MLTAVYDTGSSTDVMEIQKDSQYLKEEMTGCIYKDFTPSQLTWSRD